MSMIRFVFANEDKYYTDSMMCLNLSEKLYYELKEKNYKTVCFIKVAGERYHIDFADQNALEAYVACEKKTISFFGKKKTNVDEHALYRDVDPTQKKEFVEHLFRMMRKEHSRIAYVFTVDAFDWLREYVNDLQKIEDDNYKYGNLILIQSPIEVDGTVRSISDANSIYRTSLFPEIKEIFEKYENVPLFEKIQDLMPSRINYMNKLEEKQLENMIRSVIHEEGRCIGDRLNSMDAYVSCIWYLYHSRKFRNWAKTECSYLEKQFPENPLNLYMKIGDALRSSLSYQALDELIAKVHELSMNPLGNLKYTIRDFLQIDDCEDCCQIYLHTSNTLWERISRVSGQFIQNEELKNKILKQKEEIRRKLLTVRVNKKESIEKVKLQYVEKYLNNANHAQAMKDVQRFRYALEGIYCAICECEEQASGHMSNEEEKEQLERIKAYLDCYRFILSNQEFLFEYENKLLEDQSRLKELQNRYDTIFGEVEHMRKSVPDIYQRTREYLSSEEVRATTPPEWGKFYQTYVDLSARAKNLDPVISQTKNEIAMKKQQILTVQNNIDAMNINRSHMGPTSVSILRREMELSIKKMGPVFDRIKKEFSQYKPVESLEVESVSRSYDDLLKLLDSTQGMNEIEKDETEYTLLGIDDLI